jgi:hypothetical protein
MASIYRLRLTPEPREQPTVMLPLRSQLGSVPRAQYPLLRTRLSRRPRRTPVPSVAHHSVGDYLKYLDEA